MKKTILYAFLFLILLSGILINRAHAQSYSNINNQIPNTTVNYTDENSLNFLTQSVMLNVLGAVSCQIAGENPVAPNKGCLGLDYKNGQLIFVKNNGGAISVVSNLIATIYMSPPASSSDYFRHMAQNFGLVKNAYANSTTPCNPTYYGEGICALSPFMTAWTIFRNITYVFFVIIFIFIGFGIMFRLKINPQTIMSIENQIPKIIIGILLVTFSYAIAGFLIDLMYLSLYLIFGLLISADPTSHIQVKDIITSGPLGAFSAATSTPNANGGGLWGLATTTGGSVQDMGYNILNSFLNSHPFIAVFLSFFNPLNFGPLGTVGGIAEGVGSVFRGGSFASGFADAISTPTSGIIGAIAAIIFFFSLIIVLIRVFWMLLKAYIFILINVVFGPFFILLGLVPGSTMGFGMWIRDLASNLAVFPAVMAMFLIARIFYDTFSQGGNSFVPPMLGLTPDAHAFAGLIGFAVIMITPEAAKMTKAMFKTQESKTFGTAGTNMMLGAGVVGTPMSKATSSVTQGTSLAIQHGISEKLGDTWGKRVVPGIKNLTTRFGEKVVAEVNKFKLPLLRKHP